jgi:hypothetical protein
LPALRFDLRLRQAYTGARAGGSDHWAEHGTEGFRQEH